MSNQNPIQTSNPLHDYILLSQLQLKFPSWSQPDIFIIIKMCKQNFEPEISTMLQKLQKNNSSKTKEEVAQLFEYIKEYHQSRQKANYNIFMNSIQRKYQKGKSNRTTANRAKKFINNYANNINSKSQRKKKISGCMEHIQYLEQEQSKKKKTQQNKCIANQQQKWKRKINPCESREIRRDEGENLKNIFIRLDLQNKNCPSNGNKKQKKRVTSFNRNPIIINNRNFQYQYFYSNYDLPYYSQNLYQQMLSFGKLPYNMSYNNHRVTRFCMGKPRLFNIQTFKNQLNRLQSSRNIIRNYIKNSRLQTNQNYLQQSFIQSITNIIPLNVSNRVLALHPICNHLHFGSILALYKQNLIMVKFDNPQLGVQKILDINISSEYNENMNSFNYQNMVGKQQLGQRNQSFKQYSTVISNLDYTAMAILIHLLDIKTKLVMQLSEINNIIKQKNQKQQQINQSLNQIGVWLIKFINLIDCFVRLALVKFRLRGQNSFNKQEIKNSMPYLLINPLLGMYKQLQTNNQAGDGPAKKTIKQIMYKVDYKIIEDRIQKMILQVKEQKNINERNECEQLVRNMIGILMIMESGKLCKGVQNRYMRRVQEELGEVDKQRWKIIEQLIWGILQK